MSDRQTDPGDDDDYVAPWWGEVDPDVMVLIDRSGLPRPLEDEWPPAEFLDHFALDLRRELQVQDNRVCRGSG
jgi:hypothetical protein